jgi:hypothetical protein
LYATLRQKIAANFNAILVYIFEVIVYSYL